MSLLRFLAATIFCESWRPWCRTIITVLVIVVIVLVFSSTGVPLYMPVM